MPASFSNIMDTLRAGSRLGPKLRALGLPIRELLTTALLGLALAGAGSGPVSAAEPVDGEPVHPSGAANLDQAGLTIGYRLSETWQDAPWAPEPGRYGRTLDVSSAPDGSIYVLDGRLRSIHVTDPAGRALRMFEVPSEIPGTRTGQWHAERLDVGADGLIYLLVRGPYVDSGVYRYRIDRLHPDGRLDFSFDITRRTPGNFRDIAARPDGRIYVSRAGSGSPFLAWPDPIPDPPGTPPPGVDIYRADGVFVESLVPSCVPDHLDFGPDSRLYLVNRCPIPLDSPGLPGPTPTTEPSLGSDRPAQDAVEMPKEEGVLTFEPDHRYAGFEPFINPEDLAAGPAGVFISRNVEIYALGEDLPLYSGPTDALLGAYMNEIVFNLDAPAEGGLIAAMNHCYFQGLLGFEDPATRPAEAQLRGALDNPHLEGPPNPGRVAVGDTLAVLQNRFGVQGARPDPSYFVHPHLAESRSVQRWPLSGAAGAGAPSGNMPLAQLGLCDDSARDLAMDGSRIYTVDPNRVQERPDDALPGWSWWPALLADPEERPDLAAVSADAGRVAALDLGRQRVSVLDTQGQLLHDWSPREGDPAALPIDLALSGEQVFLAEQGRNRIALHQASGRRIAAWPTHDAARALAAGPEGDIYVLGAGGWGMRYRPDGQLLALWPMPDRSLDARDIAVDDRGRVYVPWALRRPYGGPRGRAMPQFEIEEAGIWVFEPEALTPSPEPRRGACLAAPDKRARPARLPLGAEVEVELRVEGQCPGRTAPAQIMLLVDSSRSMSYEDALPRARDFLAAVLGQLDPEQIEIGLVSFDEGARLLQPLEHDIGGLRAAVAGLEPSGNTLMGAGIDLALSELAGRPSDPEARRIMVLATDGIFKDDPLAAAERVRAAGVELHALVFATYEYSEDTRRQLEIMTGAAERIVIDPMPLDLQPLIDSLSAFQPERGLFERIGVVDRIPANMRYIPGSSQPPADYDPEAHALRWEAGEVSAAAGLRLGYRLEPLECGRWPTNIEATADYLDALGNPGRLIFPIPEVEVICDVSRIYLPLIDKQRCHRRLKPADVVLIMDSSSSMAEPGAPDGRSKLDLARAAATSFVDLLQAGDRAAVVAFDGQARALVGLSSDPAAITAGLAALSPSPGTRIDLGLAAAAETLRASPRSGAQPVVILLTDGLQSEAEAPKTAVLDQAAKLKAGGALIYTIGLGQEIDLALLRDLAGAPDRFLASPTAEDLIAIYTSISEALACASP